MKRARLFIQVLFHYYYYSCFFIHSANFRKCLAECFEWQWNHMRWWRKVHSRWRKGKERQDKMMYVTQLKVSCLVLHFSFTFFVYFIDLTLSFSDVFFCWKFYVCPPSYSRCLVRLSTRVSAWGEHARLLTHYYCQSCWKFLLMLEGWLFLSFF